ncbi:MAG: dihydroorotate dehydrogenase [Halobacteria archaeon]
MTRLPVSVGRIRLKNPTLLASGILGSTGASLARAAEWGAGGVVTKSLGVEPRTGYKGPTVVRLETGAINAVGLSNPGWRGFLPELSDARRGGVPVMASLFGAFPAEFGAMARGLRRHVDGFELNLSCPHVKNVGSEVGSDPRLVRAIVRAAKEGARKPVWAKLTPHADVTEVGRAAERAGADALVAVNTLRAAAFDVETGRSLLGNRVGGLSGPPLKPVALRCVYELYEEVSIPIVGSGGVSNWRDAVEFLSAGARAVEIGTALLDGTGVFRDVTAGLRKFLARNRTNLGGLVGRSHRA